MKYILFLLFTMSSVVYGQLTEYELDSLFHKAQIVFGEKTETEHYHKHSGNEDIHKCGLEFFTTIKKNIDAFKPSQRQILNTLLDRPSLDTSIVSPAGHFRVHFDTDGLNAPDYFSNEDHIQSAYAIAEVFDSVYQFEINTLGYPSPPPDKGRGGDDLFDVYILNLGNYYGVTAWEEEVTQGSGTYQTFMQIDNDYDGYFTEGFDGARVTAAHEFHHAIQLGNYVERYGTDAYWYEITSTSMEEFMYDNVNDYYGYFDHYFRNPERAFNRNNVSNLDGYDLCIWNIYLKERFGYDIIKRIWELMPEHKALKAIDLALKDPQYSSSFQDEYHNFGIWCFFTGHRYQPNQYFDEAKNYPVIDPLMTTYVSEIPVAFSVNPASNTYMQFTNITATKKDTLMALISNGDIAQALEDKGVTTSINYTLDKNPIQNGYSISGEYNYQLDAENSALFLMAEFLNNVLPNQGGSSGLLEDYAYPSPYDYRKYQDEVMVFNFSSLIKGEISLNIYTLSMERIYENKYYFVTNGTNKITWNARNNNGEKLDSGVYIYAIKHDAGVTKGKVVIVND